MRRPRRCWGPLIANGANGGLFGNGWSGGLLIQDGLPGGSIITDNTRRNQLRSNNSSR